MRVSSSFYVLICIFNALSLTTIGDMMPVSASQLATVLALLHPLFYFFSEVRHFIGIKIFTFYYALFLFWAIISTVWGQSFFGVQNVMVYLVFYLNIMMVASVSQNKTFFRILLLGPLYGTVAVAFLYLLLCARYGLGHNELIYTRPFALTAAIVTPIGIGYFRTVYGALNKIYYLLLVAIMAGAVFATLSRTALAITMVLVAFSVLYTPGSISSIIKLVIACVLSAVGFLILMEYFPEFAQRFEGKDVVKVGEYDINFTGRTILWMQTYESWTENWVSILFGKGAGSVGPVLQLIRPEPHPHNEFLRLLHDYGVVGFMLWIIAIISLIKDFMFKVSRKARVYLAEEYAVVSIAATSALFGYLLACFFLNPLVFVFVTFPVAILSGMAISLSRKGQ